jgi:autotransporter-associated beta strand protein
MNLKSLTKLVMTTMSLGLASPPPAVPRLFRGSVHCGVVMLLFFLATAAFAGSATWKANPGSGTWNTAANWTPATIPNGAADTATFAFSGTKNVFFSADTEVNGIVFNAGASPFTLINQAPTVTISGKGITNNSGIVQNFTPGSGQIVFANSATAGSLTSFTNGGAIAFAGSSSAGKATFSNDGELTFLNTSTAGDATFINEGGKVSGAGGATIVFDTGSTAGNALITTNGGAVNGALNAETLFRGNAGNATLIANGGSGGGPGGLIHFVDASRGGTARVEVFGNGNLDISGHATPGMTVGSMEGNGRVFLGTRKLTVGSNNQNTTFSGSIRDGGANGGIGGSLAKTGTGELVLGRGNTYTGGTIITRGHLTVNNQGGSGTGIGPVQVNGGFLSGFGTITGAVNIGNGVAAGAVLLPGTAGTAASLTINNSLTFNPLSTYECVLVRTTPAVGKVNALGVIIHSGVTFEFVDRTTGTLTRGTVFTAINNISANPIGGTFANLADGTTFSSGGNTFKANYHGGNGNDLVLTVQ